MAICGSADFVDSFVFVNLLMVDALLDDSHGSGRCVALDAIAAALTAIVSWPVFCDYWSVPPVSQGTQRMKVVRCPAVQLRVSRCRSCAPP